jgi:hypothetical protein
VAFLASYASAVHDLVFQLDGDVSASTPTNVGGNAQTVDWDSLQNADGTKKTTLPANFTAATGVIKDFNNTGTVFETNDTTTFATGSKDTLPITPGWQCNFDANVNSKIDIMNAYAATYTDTAPNPDHEILYFALERNTNTGDANVAFWFLQSPASCESEGGNHPFTGEHQDGDLLVVSAFTNGGVVSNVDVYRWDRTPAEVAADLPGHLNTTPVIEDGSDCRTTGTASPADDACGVVNTGTLGPPPAATAIPWLTANKADGVGHTLRSTEFYEGGVDLTSHGLGGKCFNTFLADTRSSQSLTATLFDYASGQLGACAATMTTQVSNAGPVLPGVAVHDTATVTGNKEITPTGNVTFFLCGPIAAPAVCNTGGSQVGSPVGLATVLPDPPINDASAQSADVNTAASPLAPGRYCFRAEWPGDTNYTTPLKEFSGTTECFTVQDTSSISTAQKWLPQDSATVTLASGGTPAGTVVFSLYENGTCSGTAATTFSDSTAPFETNNGTYRTTSTTISWSATFTPTDPGIVGSTTTQCERSDLTINDSASSFPPSP